jgi:hypothetical protein
MIQAATAMIRAGTAIDVRADDVILMASTRILERKKGNIFLCRAAASWALYSGPPRF